MKKILEYAHRNEDYNKDIDFLSQDEVEYILDTCDTGTISVERDFKSKDKIDIQNVSLFFSFKQRNPKYRIYLVEGAYTYTEEGNQKAILGQEGSFLIADPTNSRRLLKHLIAIGINKYDQQSIMYIPKTTRTAWYYYNNKTKKKLGEIKLGLLGELTADTVSKYGGGTFFKKNSKEFGALIAPYNEDPGNQIEDSTEEGRQELGYYGMWETKKMDKKSKVFDRVYNLRLLTEELGEETMDLFERVREGKVKFVDSQAYWISPSGEITSVGLKHINEIIDNPEAFGLTKEFVKETYAKFGEKMNTEGKAREEIMALLMKQGWIRIRYQPRQDSFTVQLWRLGRRPKDLIWSWANAQEESNSKRSYSDVVILLLGEDNRVIRTSVNGIVREELLDENEKKEAKRLYEHLRWVNSSGEFTKSSCYLA